MTNEEERCPHCDESLQGNRIPEEDRHLFGNVTHFSLLIGISDGDSIGYWLCPFCETRWPRKGGFAELARRNIDRMEQ